MNIYIGNLTYDCSQEDLQGVFAAFGRVESIKIIKDQLTGQSKGFGFVEMPDKAEAQAAILGISNVKGKRVTVNEARPALGGERGRSPGGSGNSRRNSRF